MRPAPLTVNPDHESYTPTSWRQMRLARIWLAFAFSLQTLTFSSPHCRLRYGLARIIITTFLRCQVDSPDIMPAFQLRNQRFTRKIHVFVDSCLPSLSRPQPLIPSHPHSVEQGQGKRFRTDEKHMRFAPCFSICENGGVGNITKTSAPFSPPFHPSHYGKKF